MKKRIENTFIALATLLLAAGCSKEVHDTPAGGNAGDEISVGVELKLMPSVAGDALTRSIPMPFPTQYKLSVLCLNMLIYPVEGVPLTWLSDRLSTCTSSWIVEALISVRVRWVPQYLPRSFPNGPSRMGSSTSAYVKTWLVATFLTS